MCELCLIGMILVLVCYFVCVIEGVLVESVRIWFWWV